MKYFRSHEKNIYLKCGCSMLCPTTRYTHVSISTLLKSFCPIFSLFRLLLMRPTCFFLSSHSRRRRRSRRWCCCFLSLIHYTFFCSRFFHVCFFCVPLWSDFMCFYCYFRLLLCVRVRRSHNMCLAITSLNFLLFINLICFHSHFHYALCGCGAKWSKFDELQIEYYAI